MGYLFSIWGVRGSMSVSGDAYSGYGSHTTCFSLNTPDGLIVIDAGTGITSLFTKPHKELPLPPITLLFTHFHLDHVIGLPVFLPLYNPKAQITVMADASRPDPWRQTLSTIMAAPFWPVPLPQCGAQLTFLDLPPQRSMTLYGIRISWIPIWHPQQCLSFRFDTPKGSIVVATDREHGQPEMDAAFLAFCRDADALIYDAQYTPDEYPSHHGWGHSTWLEGVDVAKRAGVKELILTHHDRERTDAQEDALIAEAQHCFPNTGGAREGQRIEFTTRI